MRVPRILGYLDLGHPDSRRILALFVAAAFVILFGGCSQMYYRTMESFGVPKREILSDRVAKARGEQKHAKETFESALEQFRSVVTGDAGELERKYDKLNGQLKKCESRATSVSKRIRAIEDVAEALFKEWEAELEQYQSQSLRRRSEDKLRDTRQRYEQLITVMRRAEDKMAPVLAAFREQVLFLKHNLNAAAIASLRGEVVAIERDVADLVAEMERAIAEADTFISNISG